jgi:3-polyprenyl-4-hydroxybenzoate decarboxylase
MAEVEGLGELKTVLGADSSLEIGRITELAQHRRNGPAVLFDEIRRARGAASLPTA